MCQVQIRYLKSWAQTVMLLTSDWLPGSGSCGPSAPPPPAWSAPPPAAAASLEGAAACWPGWSPAGGPPSRAGAARSPGRGPPRPAPTSSHCPAVLAGAVYSAPWENGKQILNFLLTPGTGSTRGTADSFIVRCWQVQALITWLQTFVYINFAGTKCVGTKCTEFTCHDQNWNRYI